MILCFVTSYGYDIAMKQVRIADLKAHLSEHLREVRRGRSLTVLDRDTPIARIVPFVPDARGLTVRKPRRRLKLAKVPLPPPLPLKVDILELLREERQSER